MDPDPDVFFGLLDQDPDPSVRGMDPAPGPSLKNKNNKKNLDSYLFETFLCLFIFENDVNVPSKSNKQKKNSFLLAS